MMKSKLLLPLLLLIATQILYSQGNVGIGTTTPQAKLDVNGTFKLQNGVIVNGISADSTFTPGSDSLLPTQLAVKRYLKSGAFAPHEEVPDSILVLRDQLSAPDPSSLYVDGNFLYAVYASENKMQIFNISNPDSIALSGSTTINLNSPIDIAVANNKAYVTNYTLLGNKLVIFDVSNPANITLLGYTAGNMHRPTSVEVLGNIAYVTSEANNTGKVLFTFDITDPNQIIPLGESMGQIFGTPTNIRVKNGMAYVPSADQRFSIFDVSNPATIAPRGTITANLDKPISVDVHGNYAYVASNFNHKVVIFNISDPDNIGSAGLITSVYPYPNGVRIMDNKLVVSNGGASLYVFDLASNPTQPILKFMIEDYGRCNSIATQGNYVFNASYSNSKLVMLEWVASNVQQTLILKPDGTTAFSPGWQTDSLDNIYRMSGHVGIGTSMPEAALHIVGAVKIDSENTIEFGAHIDGKNPDAGKIGYNTFSGNALDIVGAGPTNNRKIKFYSEGGALLEGDLRITDSLYVNGHSDLDGNVLINHGWLGIGNYAPQVPLHLSGLMKIDGANTIEFGAGVPGKQVDAGKIGYQVFSTDALDIIGAGTNPSNRKVKFYAEGGSAFTGKVDITGKLTAGDSVKINAPTKMNGNLLVNNGWVGIGNLAPLVPLHLSGLMKIDGTNTIEFGAGVSGKQPDAGKIGYQSFSTNALDIIGAGPFSQRRIKLWAEQGVSVEGKLFVSDSISGTNAKFSGDVGIGIANPTAKLHVAGNQKIDGTNSLEFGAGVPGKQVDAGKIGYTLYSNGLDIIGAGATNQRRIKLWAEGGTTVDGKMIGTDSIRIAGAGLFQSNLVVNGNLGINTPNPTYKLDVNGRMRLRHNGESSGIYFNKSNNTEEGFVGMQSDNKIGFYGSGGGDWNFVMNTTNGNVGIGTTNPTATLHVGGNQKMNNANTLEFGSNVAGKNQDAGKIGYQTYTTGALDIVGAGTTAGNRKVKIWDQVVVPTVQTDSIVSGAWQAIDLWNGWTNFGNGAATAAWYKDPMGVIHFRGTIKGGDITGGTVLFGLLPEFAPSYGTMVFMVPNGNGSFARIEVRSNGDFLFYGSNNSWLSLDQISYRTY